MSQYEKKYNKFSFIGPSPIDLMIKSYLGHVFGKDYVNLI